MSAAPDGSGAAATRRDIALTGPMGAGKTTAGRLLAGFLGRRFVDLDALIEEREGRTVAQLFAAGEPVFRAAEAAAVRGWLERPADAAPEVLALGGGTLQNGELAESLARRAFLFHLDAPAGVLARRLKTEDVRVRPLVNRAENLLETLAALREARAPGYARADHAVSTADRGPESVAVAVLRTLYDARTGAWREPARLLTGADGDPVSRTSLVTVGRGAVPLEPVPGAALLWDRHLPEVHASHVLPHLEECAGGCERLVRLDAAGGEGAKTPEHLVTLWRTLLDAGVDRDTPLWVAGGGTLTDLGGLLAHTYKRGLPLVLFPTTLLAQLDAGLGGKNGINLDRTKNAIGTTRLPDAVHLDPLFLLTLGPTDLRGGLSEAVKSGLIGDPELVDEIEAAATGLAARPLADLERIAARAAAVKLAIVDRDLEEQGERRVLNLGHTLGHALEAATAGWATPVAHGDAVAVGMVFAARLARRTGALADPQLPERLEALLAALGLPVRPPKLAPAERDLLQRALARDKKRFRGENVWVLPVTPGRMALRVVAPEDVAAELAGFLA